jgi:tetratricopeptide (TPR) repeat protein
MNETLSQDRPPQAQLIQDQLKAGVQAHVRGNLSAAESAYKAVLSIDEKNATAHNNLGFVYGQKSEWKNAINHLQTATEIKPDYATALSNLGQIYFSIGEKEKGIELLERAVQIDDQDAQNWHNLARISLLVSKFQTAEYAWWRAHNLQPQRTDYSVNLGIAIAAQHRFADAEKIYQAVLRVDPNHFNALLQLGICWLLMKNYGNAKNALLNAYVINQQDASVLRHLSLVELSLGDKKMASRYLQKLLQLFPDDHESRLDYALILLDLKELDRLAAERKLLIDVQNPSERLLHYLKIIETELS